MLSENNKKNLDKVKERINAGEVILVGNVMKMLGYYRDQIPDWAFDYYLTKYGTISWLECLEKGLIKLWP